MSAEERRLQIKLMPQKKVLTYNFKNEKENKLNEKDKRKTKTGKLYWDKMSVSANRLMFPSYRVIVRVRKSVYYIKVSYVTIILCKSKEE